MKTSFREKIREQVANPSLQEALDGNAERRVQARVNAMSGLPDWQARRQKAHALRAEVIDHLDEYAGRFAERAEDNGIYVHRAASAAEAVRLVLEISDQVGLKPAGIPLLFAKAKSMVSEEIGLNHALAAAGHQVFETDLGEYIVQLRGERPAHILTPAVHLRRQDVGQLFHEKLGIPYTEDVRILTDTARLRLREVFLSADVGLTGVNFGVADTGTLVLVSNEGNARMCSSLPPIHIALMGMERIVPNLDDLAVCLSLLARSATGQKLSVYTQFIQRPENGQQKHIILIDNGRTRLRNSPLKESLYCIRCGSCLNACPVFREIGGHGYLGVDGSPAPYSGPIGSVVSPGLLGSNFSQLAHASTLCGACKQACPVDIDLPKLLLRVRAGEYPSLPDSIPGKNPQPRLLNFGLQAYSRLSAHPRLFSFAQKLAGLASLPLPAFIPMPALTGWGSSKDLPRPAAQPFRAQFSTKSIPPASSSEVSPATQAALSEFVLPDKEASLAERVETFSKELTAVGGHVYVVQKSALLESLIDFLHERGINQIQSWTDIPGLSIEQLALHGFKINSAFITGTQAGLTGALAGIADSGTLVIPAGGQTQPMTASLLSPLHIAVLSTAQIMSSLEQVARLPQVTAAPATVLITGPSRTGDIEMTLTIGVHGPAEVHVFVVDDAAIK